MKKKKKEDTRSPKEILRDEKLARSRQRQKAFARKQLKKKLKWFYLAFVILILDQLTKWAAMEYIIRPYARTPYRQSLNFLEWYTSPPHILPFVQVKITSFFNIVMVWNTGVSFGLLGNWSLYGYIILIAIALIITAMFCVWLYDSKNPLYSFAYALIIGGALGNALDRLRFQAVIDFLDFHYKGIHFWAFNIADTAVVSGVIIILAGSTILTKMRRMRYKKSAKKREKQIYRYGNHGR